MITFTRCAFMAKQACATFSKVVQKITPPIANNFLKFFFALFATLTLNAATAWAEEVTYQHVFTAKPSTGNNISLSNVKWNIEATNLGAYNSGNYAGVQIGTKDKNGTIKLTSNTDWGYNGNTKITEVRLWLNLGGTSVTPTVTIGGKTATSDGTKVVKNSTAGTDWKKSTKVTFTPALDGNTGVVVIEVSTVKAGYICAMEIDCEPASSSGETPGEGGGENPADPTPGAGGTVTYTVSSVTAVTTTGNVPQGSTAVLSGTGSLNSGFIQCSNGKNHTLTLTGYEGYMITGITIHVKSNSGKGTGSFSVMAGSTAIASITESAFNTSSWNGSWNTTGVDKTLTMTNDSYEIQSGENVTLTINCKSGSKDYNSLYVKSYTITYEPVASTDEPENPSANYTVKHYLQNIQDDNYTLKDTKTLSGEVGTDVTPAVESYEGFTAPSTQTVTIASDGSTVVEYKYTRNSYKLTWDLDDGTITTVGTTAGQVKYGAIITAPSVTKDGYQFNNWNPSVPATMPAGDATYTAQWSRLYTITWIASGEEFYKQENAVEGTSLVLPDSEPEPCEGKVFMGWSSSEIDGNTNDEPADLFTTKNINVENAATTYYAVFATPKTIPGEMVEEEVTAAVNISSYATANGWTNGEKYETVNIDDNITAIASGKTFTGCYYTSGTNWRLYYSEAATLTIKAKDGITIKSLKITYLSEKNGVLLNNEEQISSGEECTVNAESVQFKTGLSSGTESGQVRITKMEVTYTTTVQAEDIVTYSNYSTTCVPAPKLVSIAQTAGQTEFTEGDAFVKATITATYDDKSTKDVTSEATFSTPDMTQVGEQMISVSYKEGKVTAETSYEINIKEKTKYTITWWANGEEFDTQTDVEGTAIEVPTTSPEAATYACDDKVFVGWVEAEISGSTDAKPALIADFDKITKNKDFFAVFATKSSSVPAAYTAGDVGDFVLAAKNGDKWHALPTNPVVTSGKIQGVEIPVTTTNGVEHVTTTNALGYTWTIANAANGQTISDGSKYIYHKNGGVDDTDLSYGTGTSYTWKIEKEDAGLTFQAMNGATVNSRGMLVNGTKFGGYSLTNETTSGYYRISVLPIADAFSYSGYVTTCEAATEALSGTFSVGKYEVAQFATGNLQYKPSTDTWRFAKQQYQYVGKDNIYVGKEDYKGWIDLFGWSADGNFGVNPSNKKDDYTNQFVDWGSLFPEEGWSTLSKNQWNYLLNERPNYSKLKQIAMVGETLGIMLFPDEWTLPAGCAPTEQAHHDDEDGEDHSCDFVSYNYTLAQWTELENAGAIFLPAAGRRTGGWGNETISPHMIGKAELDADGHYKHYADYYAYYWTSTKTSDKVNYLINCTLVDKVKDTYTVHAGHVNWAEEARYGQSVRLAKVTSTLIEIGDGNNSTVIADNEGEKVNVKVNRTFKANDGYYTICLPFNIDADEIGKAYQVTSITEHVAEEGFFMVFDEVETLIAGQPYLILPNNLTNPIFENVTISYTGEGETVAATNSVLNFEMVGVINGGGKTATGQYWVGDNGYFYNGDGTPTDKLGLRVLFNITDNNGQPVKVRARVVVGENTTTGVDNSQLPITNIQKVIENGQLIIIRNGEKYNIQGQKL